MLLQELALRRLSLSRNDPDALEELGEAMELLGDVTAVDTVRKARSLTKDPSQRLRLVAKECWLRLRVALPRKTAEIVAVRILAESLLANGHPSTASDANLLASLATLIGNAPAAASFGEQGAGNISFSFQVPREVLRAAGVLMAYASVGGPLDSLERSEQRLRLLIQNGVVPDHQAEVANNLIGQAASIAFPYHRFSSFATLDTATDYLLAAERQYAAKEWAALRKAVFDLQRSRSAFRASDLTLDGVYAEAWLLAAVGDTVWALRHITESLDALPVTAVSQFGTMSTAGSLVRAMLLRAALASGRADNAAAREWAHAVVQLSDTNMEIGRKRAESAQGIIGRPALRRSTK